MKCVKVDLLTDQVVPMQWLRVVLQEVIERGKEKIPKAPRLQLSSANIDRHGVYILDQGDSMYMMVCGSVSDAFCKDVLDVPNFMSIPEGMVRAWAVSGWVLLIVLFFLFVSVLFVLFFIISSP